MQGRVALFLALALASGARAQPAGRFCVSEPSAAEVFSKPGWFASVPADIYYRWRFQEAVDCLAVVRQDPGLCDRLAPGDAALGYGPDRGLVNACRRSFYLARLAKAAVAGEPLAPVCRSLRAERAERYESFFLTCDDIAEHPDRPDLVCSLARAKVPEFAPDAPAAERKPYDPDVCRAHVEGIFGRGDCAVLDPDAGRLNCAIYGAYRKAREAMDPRLCGDFAVCRALMGEGEKGCYDFALRARGQYCAHKAARRCGSVSVLGRPLPEGFAFAGGSSARIRGGRFCLEGSTAAVSVSALGLWSPLKVRHEESGGSGDAELAFVPESGAEESARVRGTLEFPKGARALEKGPALVMVQTLGGPSAFAWVGGPLKDGKASFELPVKPGKLRSVQAFVDGWGIFSLDPPFHPRYNDAVALRTAQDYPLTFTMKPAGRLAVRVREGGAAFRPEPARPPAASRLFGFYVSNPDNAEEFYAYAGPDGAVAVANMPAGLWQLQPVLDDGLGRAVRAGPELAVWIAAGRETALDYELGPEAWLRVSHESVPLKPYWQQGYAAFPPKARWVVGFPAGSDDPRRGYRYSILEEAAFGVTQRGSGAFRLDDTPSERDQDQWVRVPAGAYDAFLLDNAKKDFPYARVLAVKRGQRLGRGVRFELAFSSSDYLPAGTGEIQGSVQASMRWTFQDIEKVKTISDFYLLLGPYANVYDEAGRLEGTAFTEVSLRDYKAFFEARERGDLETVRRLFYGRPRSWRARDLPPGRHSVELVVPGYPLKRFPVTVDAAQPARFSVDLDRAP